MRWKSRFQFSLGFMTFLLTVHTVALASSNPLNDLFRPFQYLDISAFYNAYHYWVDFFIFLCLFVSVGKITLGRRFRGREGKILSVIVGFVLALSLSLLEYRLGFSIRFFGPIAAGILIFLAGIIIFYLVKSVGAESTSSGSIAFVFTYFLVRAAVPELFLWADNNPLFALLHIAFVVALIISIWKIIGSLSSGRDIKTLARTLENASTPNPGPRRNTDDEKQKIHLIKRDLRHITKKGVKEGGNIIEQLEEIKTIVEKYGSTDRAKHLIAEKINTIASKENLMLKELGYLKNLSERFENFDQKLFGQLRTRWDKAPDSEKDILKEEILLEKDKIVSEEELRKLESVLSQNDSNFRLCLSNSVQCLRSNQPIQAKEWLLKAIRCEEGAMNILSEMKDKEDKLLKLTKREFRTFKKEWKDEKG